MADGRASACMQAVTGFVRGPASSGGPDAPHIGAAGPRVPRQERTYQDSAVRLVRPARIGTRRSAESVPLAQNVHQHHRTPGPDRET